MLFSATRLFNACEAVKNRRLENLVGAASTPTGAVALVERLAELVRRQERNTRFLGRVQSAWEGEWRALWRKPSVQDMAAARIDRDLARALAFAFEDYERDAPLAAANDATVHAERLISPAFTFPRFRDRRNGDDLQTSERAIVDACNDVARAVMRRDVSYLLDLADLLRPTPRALSSASRPTPEDKIREAILMWSKGASEWLQGRRIDRRRGPQKFEEWYTRKGEDRAADDFLAGFADMTQQRPPVLLRESQFRPASRPRADEGPAVQEDGPPPSAPRNTPRPWALKPAPTATGESRPGSVAGEGARPPRLLGPGTQSRPPRGEVR